MVRRSRNGLIALGATLLLAILLSLIASGSFERRPPGSTADALQRIEAKNRKAAMEAAAAMRAESEASAEAADREAALRDDGNAAAQLTRFETVNRAEAAR